MCVCVKKIFNIQFCSCSLRHPINLSTELVTMVTSHPLECVGDVMQSHKHCLHHTKPWQRQLITLQSTEQVLVVQEIHIYIIRLELLVRNRANAWVRWTFACFFFCLSFMAVGKQRYGPSSPSTGSESGSVNASYARSTWTLNYSMNIVQNQDCPRTRYASEP